MLTVGAKLHSLLVVSRFLVKEKNPVNKDIDIIISKNLFFDMFMIHIYTQVYMNFGLNDQPVVFDGISKKDGQVFVTNTIFIH